MENHFFAVLDVSLNFESFYQGPALFEFDFSFNKEIIKMSVVSEQRSASVNISGRETKSKTAPLLKVWDCFPFGMNNRTFSTILESRVTESSKLGNHLEHGVLAAFRSF